MEINEFKKLIDRYVSSELSPEEESLLKKLLNDEDHLQQLAIIMDNQLNAHSSEDYYNPEVVDRTRIAVIKAIRERDHTTVPAGVRTLHFLKTNWFKYAAIVLLIAGSVFYLNTKNQSLKELSGVPSQHNNNKTADIQPGGNKAVLTLADGSIIVLDSAVNGNLAAQGNTKILKLEAGALAYEAGNASGELLYNTIATPKGGQYQITLADGTKVWLNAASSLRFPTAFNGKQRVVELKGEAYMEIAPNSQMPFKVKVNDQTEVQVLGTAFNINAYANESRIATTLTEGAVRISAYNQLQTLAPGQQLQVDTKGKLNLIKEANIEKVLAWKNGFFNFEGAGISELMRQVERWYDVEVFYEKGIPAIKFVGEMSKNVSLSDLLSALKDVGVNYRLEGRKLFVMPGAEKP